MCFRSKRLPILFCSFKWISENVEIKSTLKNPYTFHSTNWTINEKTDFETKASKTQPATKVSYLDLSNETTRLDHRELWWNFRAKNWCQSLRWETLLSWNKPWIILKNGLEMYDEPRPLLRFSSSSTSPSDFFDRLIKLR